MSNSAPTAEDMRLLLATQAAAAASDEGDGKADYYRKKKAKEFAQAYVFVKDFRAELLEAEPDLTITEALLSNKLYELWAAKAEVKGEREV